MSHERFLDVHQKYVQWAEKITLPPGVDAERGTGSKRRRFTCFTNCSDPSLNAQHIKLRVDLL